MLIQAHQLKHHPSLSLHKEMAEICQPIFSKLNYSILNFFRLYNDGRIHYLCDNHAWLQHYLTHGFPSIGAFEQNPMFCEQEFILWNALSDTDPIVIYSRTMFNIKHGITLTRKFADGCDFFNFGRSEYDSAIQETMLQQLANLEQFIPIFYQKVNKLLAKVQQQPLDLHQFNYKPEYIPKKNRLYLGPDYHYAYLTQKEMLYLKELIAGLTIPDIAKKWQASPRTIEKHVENIKEKLNCRTQFELGYTAAKLAIPL